MCFSSTSNPGDSPWPGSSQRSQLTPRGTLPCCPQAKGPGFPPGSCLLPVLVAMRSTSNKEQSQFLGSKAPDSQHVPARLAVLSRHSALRSRYNHTLLKSVCSQPQISCHPIQHLALLCSWVERDLEFSLKLAASKTCQNCEVNPTWWQNFFFFSFQTVTANIQNISMTSLLDKTGECFSLSECTYIRSGLGCR